MFVLVKEGLSQVIKRNGSKRIPPSPKTIEDLNSSFLASISDTTKKISNSSFDDVVIGNEVLNIPNGFPYNIHYPFRRGDLNLHNDVGGSLSSIMVGMYV